MCSVDSVITLSIALGSFDLYSLPGQYKTHSWFYNQYSIIISPSALIMPYSHYTIYPFAMLHLCYMYM